MLYEKDKFWFVDCDGCANTLMFYYSNRSSAISDIKEECWELTEDDKCYCNKCIKKRSSNQSI